VDSSQVSPIDLIESQPYRVHFRAGEKIFSDGHYYFQTMMLNAGEVFKNWPVVISRIVSDSTGTSMYDTTNTLWNHTPADSAYSAAYDEARVDFVTILGAMPTVFPVPDSVQLAYFDSAGYTIQLLEDDAIKVSNDTVELLYEPQEMRISTKNYEGGLLIREHELVYVASTGYGVVPETEREIRYEIRPSGICMEKVLSRRYSDYSIVLAERSQPDEPDRNKKANRLAVWPNPAADAVFVQLPDDVAPGSTVRIMNASGTTLMERTGMQPGVTLNFMIQHLPAGVYHLQAERLSGLQTQKIVKQ